MLEKLIRLKQNQVCFKDLQLELKPNLVFTCVTGENETIIPKLCIVIERNFVF